MSNNNRNGVRLLAELVVIFLGVTLGFLAEDVRQGREDDARAASILSQLQGDLASDSVELARILGGVDRYAARGREMLLLLSRASPPADSIKALARSLLFYPIYRPSSAAYVNLKEGGQLSLVSDVGLRSAITQYYERDRPLIDELWVNVIEHRNDFSRSVAPHIAFQIDGATAAFPPMPPLSLISSAAELASDPNVRWAVEMQAAFAMDGKRFIPRAQEQNTELRTMLGAYFEGG